MTWLSARAVLAALAILSLVVGPVGHVVADGTPTPTATPDREQKQGIAACGVLSDHKTVQQYHDCLRKHVTEEQVLKWIHTAPSELSNRQQEAVYAFNSSDLSEDLRKKMSDWKVWESGGPSPDWLSASETPEKTPEQKQSKNVANATKANASDVSKYLQIRPGQWVTVEPEYVPSKEKIKITVYSEYDAHLASADSNDVSRTGGAQIDVTNVRVEGGKTTTFWVDASVQDGDQTVTLNSFDGADGNDDLRAVSLSNKFAPWWVDSPTWTLFWYGLLAFGIGGLVGIVMAVIYDILRGRRTWFDLYEKAVHEL